MNQLPAQRNAPQHDYILLDGSGSMSSKWWESLTAIDSYCTGLRNGEVQSNITLACFSTEGVGFAYDIARTATPSTWTQCDENIPFRAGSTPLYDAINQMMRELRDLNPTNCSIVIVTDGEENASKTTVDQARALLDWARNRGWTVTFIGCDWDNLSQAKQLGANESNTVGTSARQLANATAELAKKRAHNAKFGTPMHWTDEERKRFGGYLAG